MDVKEKKNLFKFIFYSLLRGYFFLLIKQLYVLRLNPKYRLLEAKYKLLHVDIYKLAKKLKPLSKKVKGILAVFPAGHTFLLFNFWTFHLLLFHFGKMPGLYFTIYDSSLR